MEKKTRSRKLPAKDAAVVLLIFQTVIVIATIILIIQNL